MHATNHYQNMRYMVLKEDLRRELGNNGFGPTVLNGIKVFNYKYSGYTSPILFELNEDGDFDEDFPWVLIQRNAEGIEINLCSSVLTDKDIRIKRPQVLVNMLNIAMDIIEAYKDDNANTE